MRAKIILGAGVGEDAGRDAYLAAFHAAQALILARSGKVVKTHRGVHRQFSQLAKNEAGLREFSRFLSQAYNLKDIADYELGPAPPCLSTARRPRSLWPSGSSIVLQRF